VHQVGTLADGRPFLAMKLIKGGTLEAILKDRTDPAADRGRLLAIFEAVRQAVGYAHDDRFEQSRALALLAGLGGAANSGGTTAEAARFADQAVASLRDTINAGWGWPDELKEPDFDPLRGRDDFKKLLA
jgi:hypothetical protein